MSVPFRPKNFGAGAVSITVTGTSASVALPLTESATSVRLVNAGSAVTFVRFGVGAATAVTTDLPLLPNSVTVLDIPHQLTNLGTAYLAAIGTAGNTLYASCGDGGV